MDGADIKSKRAPWMTSIERVKCLAVPRLNGYWGLLSRVLVCTMCPNNPLLSPFFLPNRNLFVLSITKWDLISHVAPFSPAHLTTTSVLVFVVVLKSRHDCLSCSSKHSSLTYFALACNLHRFKWCFAGERHPSKIVTLEIICIISQEENKCSSFLDNYALDPQNSLLIWNEWQTVAHVSTESSRSWKQCWISILAGTHNGHTKVLSVINLCSLNILNQKIKEILHIIAKEGYWRGVTSVGNYHLQLCLQI